MCHGSYSCHGKPLSHLSFVLPRLDQTRILQRAGLSEGGNETFDREGRAPEVAHAEVMPPLRAVRHRFPIMACHVKRR